MKLFLSKSATMVLRLALFGYLFCSATIAVFAEEGEEEWSPPAVVSSIEKDLEFDENQKLASHYVVFPANRPDCPTNPWVTGDADVGYGIEARQVDGEALATIFPHYKTGKSYLGRDPTTELPEGTEDNRCMAACLEKGTDIKVAGHTMPHYHYTQSSPNLPTFQKKSQFDSWFATTCKRVEVCFINYVVRDRPLQVFWKNTNTNELQKQMDLKYSERQTRCFQSFLGHEFVAIDEELGFYEEVTIEHVTTLAFGTSPPSSRQKFDGRDQVERSVKSALDVEWRKHKMIERTFSSLGFAKGKLPDDIFANMGAFYYNNRHDVVNEEWEGKGVFVNWWETDVKFVAIPWDTKRHWQLRLMELVRDWAGVELEETSMYGLRQYEQGARLLSHVDRLPTHAVSLIVNIAQINLKNPWPVEVFDHADRLHEITMEEGEIVYYESAKNLHSRNRPLTCQPGGCAFVNLFTHYRPVADGEKWHRNLSDLPNRPPPLKLGDVAYDANSDSCQRGAAAANTSSSSSNVDNFLGVGGVECADKSLGSFVSPTRFRLEEADDLLRWWKATADANLIGFDENNQAVYLDPATNQEYSEAKVIEKTREEHPHETEDYYEEEEDDDEYYGEEEYEEEAEL